MSKITGIVTAKKGDQYTITDSTGRNYTTMHGGISTGDEIILFQTENVIERLIYALLVM